MSVQTEDLKQKEVELKQKSEAWIKEKMPERLQSVGVVEDEVRSQLEVEADNWVKWNLEQFKEGKSGTDSPDAGIEKPDATKVDTPW